MILINRFSLFACILLFIVIFKVNGEFTTQDCRELGFIKTQLLCSSCENLDDFGLEELKDHCKECCQKDVTSPVSKKYPKAILEVCTCKFGAYPQIQAFVRSDRPAKFPNLTIKYVRGLDPTVKMIDDNGNVKETLSITKWNTDTVEEFFATHLENPENDDYLKSNQL